MSNERKYFVMDDSMPNKTSEELAAFELTLSPEARATAEAAVQKTLYDYKKTKNGGGLKTVLRG